MAVRYQKIVEQDLDLGYGEVTDITNPAGGTMIGNKIGLHTFTDIFTLKDYGAAGSGSVDDSEALVKATTDQGYIVITPGTYSVAQDTEIVNCVLSFEGGIISVASGKTLTLGAGCGSSLPERRYSRAMGVSCLVPMPRRRPYIPNGGA